VYSNASEEWWNYQAYQPRSEGGIVFSNVRLCVCLSVCIVDNSWTAGDIVTKFSSSYDRKADKFENGYRDAQVVI